MAAPKTNGPKRTWKCPKCGVVVSTYGLPYVPQCFRHPTKTKTNPQPMKEVRA